MKQFWLIKNEGKPNSQRVYGSIWLTTHTPTKGSTAVEEFVIKTLKNTTPKRC